jgi:hypothetical protein
MPIARRVLSSTPAVPRAEAWVIALAVLVAHPSKARADPFEQCVSAYEAGQIARNERRLLEAKQSFASCVQAECPAAARSDCARWLEEVELALPTVVIQAVDERGRDLLDVRVLIDGRPVRERLDGTAIGVDPGTHTFRYEHRGVVREQPVLLREAEKNRHLKIAFSSSAAAPPSPPVAPPAPSDARPVPTMVYVLGGVGLVALGNFAYFGIRSKVDESELRDRCAPGCPASEVDAVATKRVIADVALGAAVLSVGAAVVIYLARPSARARPPPAAAAAARILRTEPDLPR